MDRQDAVTHGKETESATGGAQVGLETLAKDQHERLLRWLLSKAGPEEALDILQESFLRAAVALDALEPIRDLAGWLWRVAANLLRDQWRRGARRPAAVADDVLLGHPASYGDPQAHVARQELEAHLKSALKELTPEQRWVVEEHCLKERSLRELAEESGLSIDTIASRKRYALQNMRRFLRDYE